ncbi:ribonuclease R [Craterilacuibacter sp.]|uniref:ribonuclease R n=1 Tax=Craterilacuibacter sp. TaxID=2870909 RepID=UPI003F2BFFCB
MPAPQKKQKSIPLRLQDPHLEREKVKYDKPLPSREFILQILAGQGVPMFPAELVSLLAITDEETPFFERRLFAMERNGEVVINRTGAVCVAQKLDLVKCKISGHRDGYGFAVPFDGEGGDLFLGEREMHKVMQGDIVMVQPGTPDRRGRREGRVVEVLEHAIKTLVARVFLERGVWSARAEDKRIRLDIMIEPGGEGSAVHGQVVVLEITEYPQGHRAPIARVKEILGNYADPGMEIEIALRKHDLPHIFGDAALAQAKTTPNKVRRKDLVPGREDLRDLPLVTIDGETARDFDDAVYAEKSGKGYRLIVAIADVSHYVQPDDALDQEAFKRSTSVYFPRRVIPMLPEALSNGICSLNPDVERMCMVCDMQLGAKGKVKSYRFYPAVIRSHARLTYNQVWDWLQNGSDHPRLAQVRTLHALFKVLLARRGKRGAIEFDTIETQMLFNESCKIDDIVPVVRNDAHRLIEECMLAANVCAAEFLQESGQKCLFRVHEGPTPEKLTNLRAFLAVVGLSLDGGDKPTTMDYAELAHKIQTRPDSEVLETMLLRSMQQAVYSPDNKGHFGLAYPAYAHFTSPIRRYPDLLVHRAIKAALAGSKYKPALKWAQLGVHCSMAERRADEASRDVESWLKAYYMRDKVGEVFTGKIAAVTSFGVFVMLDGVHVEGLVHISELGKDYFHFRKELQSIVGEKSGVQYRLGDPITVRVVRADLESSQVDFALVRDVPDVVPVESAKPRRRRGGSSRHGGTERAKPEQAAVIASDAAEMPVSAATIVPQVEPDLPVAKPVAKKAAPVRDHGASRHAGVTVKLTPAVTPVSPATPVAPAKPKPRSRKPKPVVEKVIAPAVVPAPVAEVPAAPVVAPRSRRRRTPPSSES